MTLIFLFACDKQFKRFLNQIIIRPLSSGQILLLSSRKKHNTDEDQQQSLIDGAVEAIRLSVTPELLEETDINIVFFESLAEELQTQTTTRLHSSQFSPIMSPSVSPRMKISETQRVC